MRLCISLVRVGDGELVVWYLRVSWKRWRARSSLLNRGRLREEEDAVVGERKVACYDTSTRSSTNYDVVIGVCCFIIPYLMRSSCRAENGMDAGGSEEDANQQAALQRHGQL
jgi:hypothetical protein